MSSFYWHPGGYSGGKYGTGTSAFTAAATNEKQVSRTGAGVSSFSASGTNEKQTSKFGSGIAPFVASGVGGQIREKTGAGVKVHDGTGDSRITYTEITQSSFFVELGLGHTHGRGMRAFATNEKAVSRVGLAKSIFTAKGRRGEAVRGTATSARIASGAITEKVVNKANEDVYWFGNTNSQFYNVFTASGTSDFVWVESGFTVRGYAGTGANAVTYVETGAGVSERTVSGMPSKIGTASAEFTASGADTIIFTETGIAVTPFVGRGQAQPGGAAITEFSGGGTWASLYANDNFAGREVIDVPTGDLELDSGERSWILAGGTARATNETDEMRTPNGSITITNTLWWELQVPHTCIVLLDAHHNDTYNPALEAIFGIAQRGQTTVDDTSAYASVDYHYGYDEGRGMGGHRTNTGPSQDLSGMFPQVFTPNFGGPQEVQVTPEEPLVFNVGKLTTVGGVPAGAQFNYQVYVTRLDPPENDGPDSAIFLDLAGGSVDWDMDGATGDSRWDWDQLDEVLDGENFARLCGDVFYMIETEEDCIFRFASTTGSGVVDPVQIVIFDGDRIDLWTPVTINVDEDNPYAWYAGDSYKEVALDGGKTYTVALLQTGVRNLFLGENAFASPVRRNSGTLFWEVLTQRPDNDDFADREVLSGSLPIVTTVADSRGATAETGEPFALGTEEAQGIWYEYTPATSGWYSFVPAASPGFAAILVDSYRSDPTPTFAELELSSETVDQQILWLRAGDTYYVRWTSGSVGSFDHGSFTLDMSLAGGPTNDDFADRVSISGDSGEESVDITGATGEFGEPVSYYWSWGRMPSAWYEWTPPYTGDYQFKVLNSLEDMDLGIYTGTTLNALTPVARYSTYSSVDLRFHATAGVPHQIQVAYYPGFYSPSPFTLTWDPASIPTNVTKETAIEITPDGTQHVAHNGGAPTDYPAELPDLSEFLAFQFGEEIHAGRVLWYRLDAEFTGNYEFTFSTTNWNAAAAVLHDNDGTLEITYDGPSYFNDEAVWDIGYFDGGVEDGYFTSLTSGETYYLVVFGYETPLGSQGDWSGIGDQFWAQDMIDQGEFSFSLAGTNVGDDIEAVSDLDVDEFNLNFWESYVWADADGGDEGPVYQVINNGGCHLSSNIASTAQLGEPSAYPGWPATNSVWFSWISGGAGTFAFWIESAGDTPIVDPLMSVYFSTFGGGVDQLQPVIAQSDNFDGLYPRVTFNVEEEGLAYLIQVDGRDQGTFELKWARIPLNSPPVNDDFADAIVIDEETPIIGTTTGATVECGETPIAGFFEGPFGSVWYVYNPAIDGTFFLTADVTANASDGWTVFDVFQGTTLDTLVNISPATEYATGSDGGIVGFPVQVIGGVPVYIRVSTEFDGIAFTGSGEEGQDFEFTIDAESTTPPDNDAPGDATDSPGAPGDAGGAVTPGTTDGSGYDPGEPDPINGGDIEENDPGGGSTWHRYVPDAPGFVAIYTTRALDPSMWYAVGVYAGTTAASGKFVPAQKQDPTQNPYLNTYGGAHPCFFEVREGETYWIQVVRRGSQSFGAYDLHIDEYLEYNDWSLDTDGFTSTTGGVSVVGGTVTCTGNQAISDGLQTTPQYGTIDLGTDTQKWGREVRVYFEVKMIGGQVLQREVWYGGDDWNWTNAFSDDHANIQMKRLGLLRARDTAGTAAYTMTLAPNNKGLNNISTQGPTGSASTPGDVSLGVGGPQHEDGWVPIELVLTCNDNTQNYDGSNQVGAGPNWIGRLYVNGKPFGAASYRGRQIRYLDFGMWRHPTQQYNGTNSSDQRYTENYEAWTYQMRRLRVTNIVPREPYTTEFAVSSGVYEFDGFADGAPWLYESGRHQTSSAIVPPAQVVDAPGVPGWSALHSVYPGTPIQLTYGLSSGSRRWYNFSYDTESVTGGMTLAGYPGATVLAQFFLYDTPELVIRPFGREFCVAHPTFGEFWSVQCYVDAEVMWDVKCTVYINGVLFGTYSNAHTYSEVAANTAQPRRVAPALYGGYGDLTFGAGMTTTHEAYFTNLVAAISNPDVPLGPLQTTTVAAVDDVVEHNIPTKPDDADTMVLPRNDGGHYVTIYDYMYEDTDPGPVTGIVQANGVATPVIAPRFWEALFDLQPTSAWSEENLGNWQDTGDGRTRHRDHAPVTGTGSTGILKLTQFGCSVPVDAVVTGIQVTVVRRGSGVSDATVQLYKGGSLVGSNYAGGGWSGGWEQVSYGGSGDTWGAGWSPQEVNALDFGVAIAATGGTAEVDRVTVQIFFDDEGGPAGVGRGDILAPEGLYNFYGDFVVATLTHNGGGTGGIAWPTGGWEPGAQSGGFGSYRWSSLYTLWLWQARGDKRPYYTTTVGGTTATDIRIIRNGLVYPRYAWSDDDGATYTWVYPGETDSAGHIGSDVTAATQDMLFLDNAAGNERFYGDRGGWSSGLNQDRPTSTPAMRYRYYYTTFVGATTAEDTVYCANLRARWRNYENYPSTTNGPRNAVFRVAATMPGGHVRRVGTYNGPNAGNSLGAGAASIARFTVPLQPDAVAWTAAAFGELMVRVGMNDSNATGAFSQVNDQGYGAALQALNWEILVPAPVTPPPSPCAQLIDLSMMRYPPGSGDPLQEGVPENTDLSDVRFMPGATITAVEDPTGTDLSDVLFAPGASQVDGA